MQDDIDINDEPAPKARTYSIKTVDLAQIDERSFDSSSEGDMSFNDDNEDSIHSEISMHEFSDN